jgi:hypothetical protein
MLTATPVHSRVVVSDMLCSYLPQNQTFGRSPGTDHDHGLLAQHVVAGTPQDFAIKDNHLALGDFAHRADPIKQV